MVSLLFSFHGRINRLQYWLGTLGVGLGGALLVFVLALLLGVAAPFDRDLGLQGFAALGLIVIVVCLLASWCGFALQVKRFHDRNQPGWLCLLPFAPMSGLMFVVVSSALAGHSPEQLASAAQPYAFALWGINLFFFINLGCLAGTDGPNKYGPPPGGTPSPQRDPAPRPGPPAPSRSFGGVEAAMDRAIAERERLAPAPVMTAALAAAPLPASSGAPVFGRRRAT